MSHSLLLVRRSLTTFGLQELRKYYVPANSRPLRVPGFIIIELLSLAPYIQERLIWKIFHEADLKDCAPENNYSEIEKNWFLYLRK